MTKTFRTSRWLQNPHVQTLVSALPLHAPPRTFARPAEERLTFPIEGGALVGFAWWQGEDARRTVLLVHGVGGSSDSVYLVRAGVALHRAGFHVVRLNVRGAGAGVHHAPSLHHAGMTADLDAAARALAAHPRVRDVAILGFSLGGNLTLKLAGEWGDAPPPKVCAVATISAPTDLVAVSDVMESRSTLPYRAWVVRHLVAQARAFALHHPAPYDVRALGRVRTVREYDARVVVPMHGFADPHDYYVKASAGPYVGRIRMPALIVHAEDDPMVPGWTVRPALAGRAPSVKVAWSDVGGHVAWFSGLRESGWTRTWAIDRVISFLAERT